MTDDIPLPKPDADEMARTLANWRDSAFADWLVVVVGLAAQQRPLELRRALASVFDTAAIEDMTRRATAAVFDAQRQAQEAQHLIAALHDEFDRLEKRMSGLEDWINRMARVARKANEHATK